MDQATGAIRAHRLDRLRDRVRAEPPTTPIVATRVTALRDLGRAETLARVLGGHVVRCGSAAIAIVESRTRLPADLGRLLDLPDPLRPDQPIVCLDTETTGLGTAAGTLPFLVALGRWQADEFVVRQLLLPDQPDEPAMLDVLERHIPPDAQLVSYNGRAFDWPLIVSRYRLHGRPAPDHAAHLDLLGLARQLWRHRLPDARLASVEAGIGGVRRHGDLPGALIPERYFEWLRGGDAGLFTDVLEHNRQDVVSLALLLRILSQDVLPERDGRAAMGAVQPQDLAGLGRQYARRGRPDDALACFDRALERLPSTWRDRDLQNTINADRARALGRLGRRLEAVSAWEAVALEGGPMAPVAWIAVAKSLEHVARDPVAALGAARRADALAFRSRFLGQPQPQVERDLARRLPRLIRTARARSLRAASAA